MNLSMDAGNALGVGAEKDAKRPGINEEPAFKRPRKPRKKKAELIMEAYAKGLDDGAENSAGTLATLIVGAASGVVGTLIFIAAYHFLRGLHG